MWESRVKSITDQRDRVRAELLLQEQIIVNTKDKEDDVAEIYKEEIEELQENLERKEYLLQLHRQYWYQTKSGSGGLMSLNALFSLHDSKYVEHYVGV